MSFCENASMMTSQQISREEEEEIKNTKKVTFNEPNVENVQNAFPKNVLKFKTLQGHSDKSKLNTRKKKHVTWWLH